MPEPVKVNVVSYGGVKPGQMVVGNTKEGEKTSVFDAATATSADYMFHSCTALTAWNVELPKLTDGNHMFYSCTALTAWNVELPNLTNGSYMFNGCTALTAWNVELPNLTNGNYMFSGCTALTAWNVELPNLTNGNQMFQYCALSAEGVKLIINSIPDRATAGLAVATLSIGKRTNFKTDPDVKSLLGETGDEITAKRYSVKGWDIVVTN